MPTKKSKTVAEQAAEQLADAQWLSINDVKAITGLSDVYVRHAIKTGKLVIEKQPVTEGSKTLRNMITRESFDLWRANVGERVGARPDGRNKFVLYMTPDEVVHLMGKIEGTSYAETLKRANIKRVVDEAI